MFQNKYIKQIRNEFEKHTNFIRNKFPFRNSYYKDVSNGVISIWFHKNYIEVTFQFIDMLPYEHQETIFDLAVKEQSKIHPKIECSIIECEYIEFIFSKKCLKELNYYDIINASNNLTEFCNNNVVHLVEKGDLI